VSRFWMQEVMGGEAITVPAVRAATDSAAVEAVRREPRAIGYVTMSANVDGVKVVRLAAMRGLPYWKPDPEAVHRGDYPLTRYYNLYVRTGESKLAAGFVTYVTNLDGQRIVRDAGLVPTAVPLRFVRRSPLRSSH
jgi:ABC-type phosphate transport system substrate-binding protein